MCPLYIDEKRLRANDQAASAARTSSLVEDVTRQYEQATAPEPPSFSLPSLGALGVSDAPSPVMEAIGGGIQTIGRRAQEAAAPAISWALPTLEALGVTQPKPAASIGASIPEPTPVDAQVAPEMPAGADATSWRGGGSPNPAAPSSVGYAPSTSRGAEGVERWSDLVSEAARAYNLPESTIKGLMEIESSGNPDAVSSAGAQGLMQVMCVDEETEALTQRGWLRVNDITPVDVFMTYSLEKNRMEWQPQSAPLNRYMVDEVWRLYNQAFDFIVTPNHKWVFYKPGEKHGAARYLAETQVAFNKTPRYVLRVASYDWPAEPTYSDAFVAILGWVVTDGQIPKAGRGVTVVQKKAKYIDPIRALFAAEFPTHLERPHHGGATRWSVSGDDGLRIRAVLGRDKRLTPSLLSSLTEHQAEILLQALLDGDGTTRFREKPGGSIFYGNRLDRMGDVQILCAMLGVPFNIRTAIRAGQVKPHYGAFYSGTVSGRSGAYVPTIHTEKIREETPVWCPTLPNQTWVARRNGKVSITGNSFHFSPGENPRDPRTNIMRGAKVYADALARWGDPDKAAAAYFGAIDRNGNITNATDGSSVDGPTYVRLWRQAAAKYGGTPTAGAPTPAASPPAPPAAAAVPGPSRAAGGSPDDMVTVRMPNSTETMQVPASMVGEGPGKYAPSKGWVVVSSQAAMSPLDAARASTGGETMARMSSGPDATGEPPPPGAMFPRYYPGVPNPDAEGVDDQGRNRFVPPPAPTMEDPAYPGYRHPFDVPPDAMYRGPLSQRPADMPPADVASSDEAAIAEAQELPSLAMPQRQSVEVESNGIYHYPGVAEVPMADAAPYDPRDADSGPREAIPYGPGLEGGVPVADPSIPGPDLGPGGFPIVDQPATYGPPLSEAGPPLPPAPIQGQGIRDRRAAYEAGGMPDHGRNVVDTVGRAAQAAGSAAVESYADPLWQQAPAPARAGKIVSDTFSAFGWQAAKDVAASLGVSDEELFSILGVPVSGQDLAGFAGSIVADPTNLAPAPAIKPLAAAVRRALPGAVSAGREAVEGVGRRIGEGLAENASRVAAADARMAAEGSTAAPGALGIATGLDQQAMVRPRVVPPEVADTLDFPVRVPDDPAVIRAIEAAGGRVDPERGVDLYVTRAQSPAGAGQTATRGGVFYEAVPEGGRSSFVGADDPNRVGGSQVIPPTPTRFRSPLIISDAPGTGPGFNQAIEQMGAKARPELAQAEEAVKAAFRERSAAIERSRGPSQAFYDRPENNLASGAMFSDTPEGAAFAEATRRATDAYDAALAAYNRLVDQYPPITAESIEKAVREARKAGPEGSPARAQALKDVVARYGGDPDLIDPLLAIRGADASESAWAIKENILAANARKQGYDGVVTVERGVADEAAVAAHPQVVAAKDKLTKASEALDQAADAHDAKPNNANWRAVLDANKAVENAEQNYLDTLDIVRQQYSNKITELVDVREGANPTPGPYDEVQSRVIDEFQQKLDAAQAEWAEVSQRAYQNAPAPPSPEDAAALTAIAGRIREAERVLEAVKGATSRNPPGYTLRPDVRRRDPGSTTAQASAGAMTAPRSAGPLAAVNRAASEVIAGGTGGAVIEQARNPDEDPRTAAARGFMVGAVGFPAATRLARGAARAAGATTDAGGGALATFGQMPQNRTPAVTINGRVLRASSSKPPNLIEIGQAYRHSFGMLGQVGTGLMNAMGGPISAGSGLATDVIRTGLMKGYPVPAVAEAGSLVMGLGEAARDALGTALGFVPQRVRNAPDFRPPLAERMTGPVGKTLGWVIDTPGRLATQTPDAFFGALFDRMGRRRAANELMMESGVSRLDPVAQLQEVQRLLNNPTPDEAARIAQSARAFSDELTYKGPEGYWEKAFSGPFRAPGGPTTANSPLSAQIHDLAGSFLMPFYNSIFKIHKLAATHTPGLGMVADTSKPMSERISRQLVGLAFGIWVADRAAQGLVTGPGPDDPDEKARLKASGWDEWSTYLPGVGYVKSDNLAQAAPFLKTIGAYYDNQRYPSKKPSPGDALEAGEATVKQIMRAFEGFPVLKTISDLYKVAEKPIEGGAEMLTGMGSSLVPAFVRANESSKDPHQRTVDLQAPLAERIRQRALNRVGSIPGVGSRQDSPPALDRKGEPVPNPRFGLNPLLPVPSKERKDEDPITAEMGRYGVDLDKPRDRFAFTRAGADSPDGAPGSVRVMLKPDEQQKWLQYRWQKVQEQAATAQADPRYATAGEGVRRRVWENVVRGAEEYADRALKAEIGRPALEERIRSAPVADPLPVRRAS